MNERGATHALRLDNPSNLVVFGEHQMLLNSSMIPQHLVSPPNLRLGRMDYKLQHELSDYQLAHELFVYNERTGVVVRRCGKGGQSAGSVVGTVMEPSKGYRCLRVCVNGHRLYLHRLIWLMVHGEWPQEIDHINGNPLDNRLANLRNVGRQTNNKNKAIQKNNTTGLTGIYWNRSKRLWRASIKLDGVNRHLYEGSDFFEACCKRKRAEVEHNFHFNHGVRR